MKKKSLLILILLLMTALSSLYSQEFVANYDEGKVPEYTLPDPLIFNNGSKV